MLAARYQQQKSPKRANVLYNVRVITIVVIKLQATKNKNFLSTKKPVKPKCVHSNDTILSINGSYNF